MKKVFYLTLGCASLGLGAAGTVLPVLPTVPFLLLATYSFAKVLNGCINGSFSPLFMKNILLLL